MKKCGHDEQEIGCKECHRALLTPDAQPSEEAIQDFLDTWTAPEGLEEDLRALLSAREAQALEKAAKVAEADAEWPRSSAQIAEAIRALIPGGK